MKAVEIPEQEEVVDNDLQQEQRSMQTSEDPMTPDKEIVWNANFGHVWREEDLAK